MNNNMTKTDNERISGIIIKAFGDFGESMCRLKSTFEIAAKSLETLNIYPKESNEPYAKKQAKIWANKYSHKKS